MIHALMRELQEGGRDEDENKWRNDQNDLRCSAGLLEAKPNDIELVQYFLQLFLHSRSIAQQVRHKHTAHRLKGSSV